MRTLLIVLFCFVIFHNAYTQKKNEIGNPFVWNYAPSEYQGHVQNWSIVQDKRGIMYFGNGEGVMEYDGVSFRIIPIPNKSTPRCMFLDSANRIYVGGVGDLGYLSPDETGKTRFISLMNKIPVADRKFADVWNIVEVKNALYFRTINKIFRYGNDTIKTLPSKEIINYIFRLKDELYARKTGAGVWKMVKDSLIQIHIEEQFANIQFNTVLPYGDDKLLIPTRTNGIFIYDPKGKMVNNKMVYAEKFNTQIDSFFKTSDIYSATLTENQDYILAGRSGVGGVFTIDKTGKLLSSMGKKNGLRANNVYHLCVDRDKSLWMALNNGIARAEVGLPVTFWRESNGLDGVVESIIRFNGTLYIATHGGLYYLQGNEIRMMEGLRTQTWSFMIFNDSLSKTSQLLMGASSGVYEIKDFKQTLIYPVANGAAFEFLRSKKDPNRVYISLGNGLTSMYYEKGKWINEPKYSDILDDVRSIAEEEDGSLWLGTFRNGAIHVILSDSLAKPKKVVYYKEEQGMPSLKNVLFYPYKNYYLVGTDKGLCRYDKSTDRFVPDSTFGKQFCNGSRDVFSFISDKQRKVWISGLNNRLGPIGISTPLKDGTYEWNSAPFRTIPEMMVLAFYVDDDGIGWVGGSEGLYRYDPAIPEKKLTDFRALVRKVTLNQDSVIFYGNYFENQNNQKVFTFEQPKRFKPVIAYRYNSITFQFAATSYLDEKSNQYQHYLEGFDKEWSNWSKNTQKEYTNLPKGKYIFHVKAKNSYDQYSKEAIYEFQILPPWYRTHAAYLSYVIFLGLLIWLIVKIYTRRLLAQNIYLEKVVKERTSEILQQKEEIEAQRDELEKKNGRIERQNDLIKGSIRYAKTIQHAILPAKEELDKHYENFIIYRPKDIVSGDFYWFSEIKSNYQILNFIAVCDCTGHGVPGAFMSMIGNRLLNEIVNERQIFDPKTVLEMLNLGIRKALRQDVSDNTDGMDICFCRVERSEKDTVGIIFSGANRPLIYYSKTTGQVETIRNESRTIGGERKLKVMIEFENHALELDKGDCIYLSTDGFIDQNNFERKRLGSPNLYKIIQDNIQKSMTDQKTALDTFLDFWMKSTEQRDDITIVGLKM